MKFTQIIREPSPTHQVQLISDDFHQHNLGPQIGIPNSINFRQIYQYSQQNMIMAQEMLIQPNFGPVFDNNKNQRDFRQIQVQSFRFSRGSIRDSFEKVRIIKQRMKASHTELTRPMTSIKAVQKHNDYLQLRKSMGQFTKNNQTERFSIFFQDQNKLDHKLINQKYRGPIPLEQNTEKESIIIENYRQARKNLKNSIVKPLQQQRKTKVEIKKYQKSNFKQNFIAYDYNGQPIPLKNNFNKKVLHNTSKPQETVLMTPIAEDIVIPSSTNKNYFEIRKARYLQDEKQKQNQPDIPNQQIVIQESSQFLRKIPKDIEKSRLFKEELEKDNCKRSLDKLLFSQFKKNTASLKNQQIRTIQMKQKETKMAGLSIVREEKKYKRNLKKVHQNQGKMMAHEIIFEKIFNLQAQRQDSPPQQDVMIDKFKQEKIQRVNRQRGIDSLYEKQVFKKENQKKKEGKSMHMLGTKNYQANMQKSFNREVNRSLKKSERKSMMINMLNGSLQKTLPYGVFLKRNSSEAKIQITNKEKKIQYVSKKSKDQNKYKIGQKDEQKQENQKKKEAEIKQGIRKLKITSIKTYLKRLN